MEKSEKKGKLKKNQSASVEEVAKEEVTGEKAVVKTNSDLPAFMKQGESRGMEEANVEDFEIPRLSLVQSLSKCRDKDEAEYIPGIKEMDLYNNVTREIYGEVVPIVPVFFKKEFLLWKDLKKGGGFGGACDTLEEGEALLTTSIEDKSLDGPIEDWEVVPTAQYYCLLITDNGKSEQIVISMAKSKSKVSRRWNSLIRINGNDMFSRYYYVCGISETNDSNQKYYNFKITGGDFVSEEIYKAAEEMYELIQAGKVTINRSVDGMAENDEDEGEEKF
jgi:hypothetical protein